MIKKIQICILDDALLSVTNPIRFHKNELAGKNIHPPPAPPLPLLLVMVLLLLLMLLLGTYKVKQDFLEFLENMRFLLFLKLSKYILKLH